tara:strand:- start:347 stop:703 length:357 start_codon:yes stop_codon:yes gene_type:complete
MREKRRFIRFDISVKVNYTTLKEPKTEKVGITKNISAGGLHLSTEEKLETGTKLELKFIIPEALNPAHLKGTVLWSKEADDDKKPVYTSGIEFISIEEDNKNTFLKFLCDLMYQKVKH